MNTKKLSDIASQAARPTVTRPVKAGDKRGWKPAGAKSSTPPKRKPKATPGASSARGGF